MDVTSSLIFLAVGLAVGGTSGAIIARARAASARDEKLSGLEARLSTTNAQIEAFKREIDAGSGLLRELKAEKSDLDGKYRQESMVRAAATQEARRVPNLIAELATANELIASLQRGVAERETQVATLEVQLTAERQKRDEQVALLDEAKVKFTDAFKALASDAISVNNKSFLELADQKFQAHKKTSEADLEKRQTSIGELVKPISETLKQFDLKVQELEKERNDSYVALKTQVGELKIGQSQLTSETSRLVSALRSPNTRGLWGEMQLRRVVEMAGMVENCDFDTQGSIEVEGGRIRPDMVVRLAGGRNIVVDAKTPLSAYLDSIESASDDDRQIKLAAHARSVKDHVTALGRKEYWKHLDPSPEFVVLFLPADIFYSAALQHDPSLIEYGSAQNVIITTPNTLIGLLRAISYGWKQETIARDAAKIRDLGQDLYKRILTLSGHAEKVKKHLESAVASYNRLIGSLESSVLTQARRFRDHQIGTEEHDIPILNPIELAVRAITKDELLGDCTEVAPAPMEDGVLQS